MIDYIVANYKNIIEILVAIIGTASVIIKITPTLKDDNFFLPIVRFIGKFIALDKYSPEERPE